MSIILKLIQELKLKLEQKEGQDGIVYITSLTLFC